MGRDRARVPPWWGSAGFPAFGEFVAEASFAWRFGGWLSVVGALVANRARHFAAQARTRATSGIAGVVALAVTKNVSHYFSAPFGILPQFIVNHI